MSRSIPIAVFTALVLAVGASATATAATDSAAGKRVTAKQVKAKQKAATKRRAAAKCQAKSQRKAKRRARAKGRKSLANSARTKRKGKPKAAKCKPKRKPVKRKGKAGPAPPPQGPPSQTPTTPAPTAPAPSEPLEDGSYADAAAGVTVEVSGGGQHAVVLFNMPMTGCPGAGIQMRGEAPIAGGASAAVASGVASNAGPFTLNWNLTVRRPGLGFELQIDYTFHPAARPPCIDAATIHGVLTKS